MREGCTHTNTQTQANTHTDTQSVYNLFLCPSLCLSHHWHSTTPVSFCCPLPLFILNHKRYRHSTTNTASWDNPDRLIHKKSHHNDIYWFLTCKFMYNVLHSVKSPWHRTGVLYEKYVNIKGIWQTSPFLYFLNITFDIYKSVCGRSIKCSSHKVWPAAAWSTLLQQYLLIKCHVQYQCYPGHINNA